MNLSQFLKIIISISQIINLYFLYLNDLNIHEILQYHSIFYCNFISLYNNLHILLKIYY